MKNILLIIDALGKGGAENSLAKLSVTLSKKHRVYILVFFINEPPVWETKGEIININEPASTSLLDSIRKFFSRIKKIKKIKKELKIDTSISFMEANNFYNILSKQEEKVIISVRGSKVGDVEIKNCLGKFFDLLIKLLYNKADVIVTVSEGIKTELISYYGVKRNKIHVLYNAYDLQKINYLSTEILEPELAPIFNNPVLINSGRLHIQKGQEYLLHIFSQIHKSDPTIKLVILGEGMLKENLFNMSINLGLNTYGYWKNNKVDDKFDVYFLGFKNNPYKYIKHSSVFVFPSLYEGFPNALCEAMALGTPVISSDCPTGPREIFSTNFLKNDSNEYYKEFGILMPSFLLNGNNTSLINKWTNVILSLLRDKNLKEKYSHASFKRIKDFPIEKGEEAWGEIV